jgi:hypothetical protein
MENNTRRIGPKMQAAHDYVATHPACNKLAVAKHIGPNHSLRYGYNAVDRAINAGLITAVRTVRSYRLYAE